MAIETTKPWYLSKGVIGGITAGVASMLAVFKVGWADNLAGESDNIIPLIQAVAAIVGSVIAIIGRLAASKRIS